MLQRWSFSLLSNHFKLTASSHSYCTRLVMVWYLRDFTIYYFTIAIYLLLWYHKSIINSKVLESFSKIFHGHNLLKICHQKNVTKKIKSLISKYFFENHEDQPLCFYYYSYNIYLMNVWILTLNYLIWHFCFS